MTPTKLTWPFLSLPPSMWFSRYGSIDGFTFGSAAYSPFLATRTIATAREHMSSPRVDETLAR